MVDTKRSALSTGSGFADLGQLNDRQEANGE